MTELTASIEASTQLRWTDLYPNELAETTSTCEPRRWLHPAYGLTVTRRSTAPDGHCTTPLPF